MPRVAPPERSIRDRLFDWYDRRGRSLPWRADRDPYRVWLSEIMLQQTTVAHATPYFLAFTARWPTVEDLASAADAEVMAAWAGLGYYARARHLLACARRVAAGHGGVFPGSEDELRTLPGVGPYTAAAIAAIAFDQPANVVDGNVERVLARLFAVETPLPAAKAELRGLAAGLVAANRAGDWPQALMDLGATVCTPRSPDCADCPLAADCAARAGGAPQTYPRRSPRAARPARHGAAFVLIRGERVGLVVRPPRGLLGGMAGLPTTEWRTVPWSAEAALAEVPAAASWRAAGRVEHVFTHFSLTLEVFRAEARAATAGLAWTPWDEALAKVPSLFGKVLRLCAPPGGPSS